ncbi:MAG: cell division protein FtsZ [Leptospiraceae bacterium]|nr:MAG: cell division protein FtsZ [Leptospiraceae bacterium]
MIEMEHTKTSPTIIKVVGVGGGGSNAVNRMIESGMNDVDFIVINTDEQALKMSNAPTRIVIGKKITNGMGAGGDPEKGLKAAKEDKEKIAKALDGSDMVFVTAGMGGGTGTGAAPIVAEIAKNLGALTVGVVTIPFNFEGKVRERNAKLGIEALKQHVDTLIVIKNDQIFQIIEPNVPATLALKLIDEILYNAVRGISDIINKPGIINVDFADVRNIMSSSGEAVLGFGKGVGENKVIDAVNQAINNVLLENPDISGATGVLINVCGGNDLTLQSWKDVSELITREVDPDANKIIGLTIDNSLEDEVHVVVIATGFKRKNKINKNTIEYNLNLYNNLKVQEEELPKNKKEVLSINATSILNKKQLNNRDQKIVKDPYPIRKNKSQINNLEEEEINFKEQRNNHFLNYQKEWKVPEEKESNYSNNYNRKEEILEIDLNKNKYPKDTYRDYDDNNYLDLNFEELQKPAYLRRLKV